MTVTTTPIAPTLKAASIAHAKMATLEMEELAEKKVWCTVLYRVSVRVKM